MKVQFKTYDEAQARAKKREYEQKTGVAWDFYHTGDGWRLTAIWTRETPEDEQAAVALRPFLTKEYRTFDGLASRSGLSLATVVSGAKMLCRQGHAAVTVNRNGNACAVRVVKEKGR